MKVALPIHYYEKGTSSFFEIKKTPEFRNEYSDGKNISGPGNSAANTNSAI
jgi:hypothetical protein